MSLFGHKKRIDMETYTLSEAIQLKANRGDFSGLSMGKILVLVTECITTNGYKSTLKDVGTMRNCRLASQYLFELYQEIGEPLPTGYQYNIKRDFFEHNVICKCMASSELGKSIAILTNPAYINNGRNRLKILEMLRTVKLSLDRKLNVDLLRLATIFRPTLPLYHQDFADRLKRKIDLAIKSRYITRDVRFTAVVMSDTITNITDGRVLNPQLVSLSKEQMVQRIYRCAADFDLYTKMRTQLNPLQANIAEEMVLLDERAERSREQLKPGESIKVYLHNDEYLTKEECTTKGVSLQELGKEVLLKYINENDYIVQSNMLAVKFKQIDSTNNQVI